MADLYTSYETSLALRDAGAPQEKGESYWAWKPKTKPYRLHGYGLYPAGDLARIFRADEIIEELGADLDTIEQHGYRRDWRVTGCTAKGTPVIAFADSFLEDLAAAWLAVLKEGK